MAKREKGDKRNKNNILGFIVSSLTRYVILLFCFYVFYRFLDITKVIDVIKKVFGFIDEPGIRVNFNIIIGIIEETLLYLILILGTYLLYRSISYIEELLVYRKLMIICLYVGGILLYCGEASDELLHYVLICSFLYILIDVIEYRFIGVAVPETQNKSNYHDSPICGREYLMRNQVLALEKLEKALSQSKVTDSFNMALISEWGTGKTSVIDTLIYENRNYIYLKISAQTVISTNDIISYVNSFLGQSFVKYGINLFDKTYLNNFFSIILSKSSETFSHIKLINNLIDSGSREFRNIELQRVLLGKKVQRLLKKAGKKHVVIIIDDVDRSESKEDILQLLVHFSSIQGIVSIVLLNTIKDYTYFGSKKDDSDASNIQIDKYIHLRIFMEAVNAEKEEVIKPYIRIANDKCTVNDDCWIWGDISMNEMEICKQITRHSTVYIKDNVFPIEDQYNILTELFIYNYLNSNMDFGTYFEELYMRYFFSTKEGNRILNYFVQHKDNQDNIYTELSNNWIGNSLNGELTKTILYKENAIRICRWLWMMKTYIQGPFNRKNGIGNTLFELMSKSADRINFPIITITNPEENKWSIVGTEDFKIMFFEDGMFENNLKNKDYDRLEMEIDNIIDGWQNFFIFSFVIDDFIMHVRRIVNNVRYFKMQLREMELTGQNYLDYLIDDYQKNVKYEKFIEEIKKVVNNNAEIKVTAPLLRDCVNQMLFCNYILLNGENTKYLHERYNVYLHRGIKKHILINNIDDKSIVLLDSCGKHIDDIYEVLSSEEIDKITSKT